MLDFVGNLKPPIFIVGKCWFPLNFPDIVGFDFAWFFLIFAGFCWIHRKNRWKLLEKKSNVGKYWLTGFKFAFVGFCCISLEILKKKMDNVGICWSIRLLVGICWNLMENSALFRNPTICNNFQQFPTLFPTLFLHGIKQLIPLIP